MSASLAAPGAEAIARPFRQTRAMLVAAHLPFVGFTLLQAVTGLELTPGGLRPELLPLVLLVGALQLRHSLAAADGRRPRGWPLTLLVIVVVAYAPLPSLGERWVTLQWYVIASLAMLLRGRLGWTLAIADGLAMGLRNVIVYRAFEPTSEVVWSLFYAPAVMLTGGGSLYWAARLTWHVEALRDARAGLAELAVWRERLRVSRDLHDLLGQSLSAVSLKGDLAIGLLGRREIGPAAAEIESLVSVARSALHDLRGVAHQDLAISFRSELRRATELLASIGVEARVDADDALPSPVDELFAWALREGVTNVLRHSAATTCRVRVARLPGIVRLELWNDGAAPPSGTGHGLDGLAARAAALGGVAGGRRTEDGGFVLTVDVPEEAGAR